MSNNSMRQNPIASTQISMIIISAIIIVIISIGGSLFAIKMMLKPAKIAYVETSRLMVGFSESNNVQKQLKAENDKWQAQLKTLQDSLQAMINTMSKEYDSAKPARQKELQDMLSARNQQINNFKLANEKKMAQLEQEKLKGVIDKVNVYIAEYGRSHGYSILFGTLTGGNILYGDQKAFDVTDEIVKGLNERYK